MSLVPAKTILNVEIFPLSAFNLTSFKMDGDTEEEEEEEEEWIILTKYIV